MRHANGGDDGARFGVCTSDSVPPFPTTATAPPLLLATGAVPAAAGPAAGAAAGGAWCACPNRMTCGARPGVKRLALGGADSDSEAPDWVEIC